MTKTERGLALASWPSLNEVLKTASEEDCRRLLIDEREGKRRLNFLLRIFGRYNRHRSERERSELVMETGKGRHGEAKTA